MVLIVVGQEQATNVDQHLPGASSNTSDMHLATLNLGTSSINFVESVRQLIVRVPVFKAVSVNHDEEPSAMNSKFRFTLRVSRGFSAALGGCKFFRVTMSINTETLRIRSSRISTATKRFDPSNLDDATLTAIPKRRKHLSPLEEDRPAKRSRNTNTTQTGNRQNGGGSPSTSIKKEGSKKKTAACFDPTGFPLRPNSEWRIGPHVSAAGGVENTIINAASIGLV